MPSRLLAAVGLLATVVLAGSAAALAPVDLVTDAAPPPATGPTITAAGTGTASAAPDVATVGLTVEATASGPETAREQVARDVAAVRGALGRVVESDAVETAWFAVTPVYDRRTDEPTGYRAVHALSVTTTPERAGAVVDAATAAGADRVAGVQFSLSDARLAEVRSRAVTDAVAAARADADAAAGAAGLAVVAVNSLAVDGAYPTPVSARETVGGDAGRSGTPTTFDPGPVRVTVVVRATFVAR